MKVDLNEAAHELKKMFSFAKQLHGSVYKGRSVDNRTLISLK